MYVRIILNTLRTNLFKSKGDIADSVLLLHLKGKAHGSFLFKNP